MKKQIKNSNYFIDETGDIWNGENNYHPKQTKDKDGYLRVMIRTLEGKKKSIAVHRTVMETFSPTEENTATMAVVHINGNKEDNRLENLKWIPRSDLYQKKIDMDYDCSFSFDESSFRQIEDTTYYVNKEGVIINKKTHRVISGSADKDGYIRFRLYYPDGSVRTTSIHRAVLETFNPVENMELLEINHIDGNKSNNNIENLEWVTHSRNMKHALENGLLENCSWERINGASKLTVEQVREIRKDKTHSYRKLAEIYGVSHTCIADIKRENTWKDV